MDEYCYGMDSEINSSRLSEFSSFINEGAERDLTNHFTTNEIFSSRENLVEWVRGIAYNLGFVVVTIRSDKATGQPGRKTFVLLGCERGGKYRKYKPDQPSTYGTRKCECPFQLRGKPYGNGDGWILQVKCGYHNHDLAETLVGHPYAGRLNSTEQAVLVDMTKTQVTPTNILLTLKQNNDHNVSTIKQVYTARYTYKRSLRGSRTELQQLMMMLDRDKYIHWSRCAEDSEVVSDLFWTHPDAVKLLNAFNVVLLMDSTYKTNKYRLPLLEIVGMTSTGLTYSVAFAFLSSERQNNFTWALKKFRNLFLTSEAYPQVIVSDRDVSLMNSIDNVFPQSYQLLCRFHIIKNVKAKCKMLVDCVEAWDVVMEAWENVMDCEDESMFGDCVNRLEYTCRSWSLFFEYVNNTWIIPYNTYFVKAWTNNVMHLGNTTTNRVESAHWNLKKVLGNSMGDLCSCWDAIHNVIMLQHNKIKASFENSLNIMSEAYKGIRYKRLVGRVSRYALGLIAEELERVNVIGLDKARCGCILRRTYGVPCACELTRYAPGAIPLGEFHVMWTRLSISDLVSNESQPELSVQRELAMVGEKFKEVEIGGKVMIKENLLDIVCPEMTSMIPPLEKVKTKGAQKKKLQRTERSTKRDPSYFEHVDTFHSTIESSSTKKKLQLKDKPMQRRRVPMINQFHPIFQPYILNVVDVVADGHCGYRCIAALLGLGEDSWPIIRNNLYKELSQGRDEYATLVGGYDRLEKLKRSLLVDSQSAANATKWMTIPDIGYAIANRYNVILVCLSYSQNYTIFPLRTRPPSDVRQHHLICIGHVNGNHFVQVELQDGCPLPMIDVICSNHCYPEARMWSYSYTNRMEAFLELQGITTSYVDLVDS